MKVSSSASGTDAVDVAVVFGDFAGEVIGADQDFERPAAADKARQARHGAAAGDCAAADFELTENDSLLTGETDITGEDKFAARATGARSAATVRAGTRERRTRTSFQASRSVGQMTSLFFAKKR